MGILNAVLALLLPSTLLSTLSLVGGGLVLLATRGPRARRAGMVLLGIGAAGFAVALLLPVDLWLLRPLENRFPPPAVARIDGVVVLGGALSPGITADRAMPALNRDADRLVAFAALAHRYPMARLVFAGGPHGVPGGRMSEAGASAALFESLGVPPGRVVYDDQSRTTWENAVNALALAHPAPGEVWVLLTSASHMPRAMGVFRAAGWPAMQPWPVAYRTTQGGWPAPPNRSATG